MCYKCKYNVYVMPYSTSTNPLPAQIHLPLIWINACTMAVITVTQHVVTFTILSIRSAAITTCQDRNIYITAVTKM
jgi:hypothetical protein